MGIERGRLGPYVQKPRLSTVVLQAPRSALRFQLLGIGRFMCLSSSRMHRAKASHTKLPSLLVARHGGTHHFATSYYRFVEHIYSALGYLFHLSPGPIFD